MTRDIYRPPEYRNDALQRAIGKLKSFHNGDIAVLEVAACGDRAIPALRTLLFDREPSGLFQVRVREMQAVFVAISFVGPDSLAQELGDQGTGVIVSQVVPFPWDATLPVVKAYQGAIAAVDSNAKPGFVSLEGYLAGRLVVEALKRIKGEPTREALLDAIAAAPFDFGGVTLSYGPMKNQGSDRVFFTILQVDRTFRPVTRLVKAEGQ